MKIGSGQNFHEAVALGRRYTAKQALEAGIAQAVAGAADVIPDAKQIARKAIAHGGYKRKSLLNMKKGLYKPVLDSAEQHEGGGVLKAAL